MKKYNSLLKQKLILLMLLVSPAVFAQETGNTGDARSTEEAASKPAKKVVKSTFENGNLINNQTIETQHKKSLEFVIQHRFGELESFDDLGGLWGSSNIRFGLNYGITNRLVVGVGAAKNKQIYDLNLKYAILKQTKGGGMPVSVAYFGTVGRSALPKTSFQIQDASRPDTTMYEANDRYSYFNEIMVARKINEHLSLQLAFTWSHVNLVDSGMEHDIPGVSFVGRYKFSPQSSVALEFDYPLATHKVNKNMPNLGIGYEVATSSHTFQFFICTADGINNQQIMVYNQNDYTKRQILIGFNITRMWDL